MKNKTYAPYNYDSPFHSFEWDHNGTRHVFGPSYASETDMESAKVHHILNESDGDKWFIFYTATGYWPVLTAVCHREFSEAYEAFIDSRVDELRIEPEDLKDYGDEDNFTGSFTSDGVPVDTELVQGFDVILKTAKAN
jgi:hypothetical protein